MLLPYSHKTALAQAILDDMGVRVSHTAVLEPAARLPHDSTEKAEFRLLLF